MTIGKSLTALADPTRREIFERLRRGPSSVKELAIGLPVSRPAVSQHLKALREAGLVEPRKVGTRRVYSVEIEGLRELRQYLDDVWSDALAAFKAEAEATPETRPRDRKEKQR